MKHMGKWSLRIISLFLISSAAIAGQLSIGGQFDAWNGDYIKPDGSSLSNGGWELWAPLSLSFKVDPGLSFYGQTEYGNGMYIDPTQVTGTIYLNNFSDTVIGSEISFKSFSVPSILNIGLNLPTGDQTWEGKQIAASIPTDFVNSRYRGRGFGVSGMYGLSFPMGGSEFGAAAGYSYSGTFDPTFGSSADAGQLKLGDAVFLAFNHVQPFSGNQNQVIRLSAFYFLSTQQAGSNIYQAGPNINASYSWVNPAALSFDVGGQYYFSSQLNITTGGFAVEPHNSIAPRFYLSPSYAFGDLTVTGVAKYVLQNGYGLGDTLFDGGGFLFGIDPSLRLKLDESSAFKFTAGYDYIISLNSAVDVKGNPTNVTYNNWTFGIAYEVKL